MTIEETVIAMIKRIIKHQALEEAEVVASSELYDNGIGLDSMCVAELSAVLEKTYGTDPYTSGELPQTVQDIVDFYEPSRA